MKTAILVPVKRPTAPPPAAPSDAIALLRTRGDAAIAALRTSQMAMAKMAKELDTILRQLEASDAKFGVSPVGSKHAMTSIITTIKKLKPELATLSDEEILSKLREGKV